MLMTNIGCPGGLSCCINQHLMTNIGCLGGLSCCINQHACLHPIECHWNTTNEETPLQHFCNFDGKPIVRHQILWHGTSEQRRSPTYTRARVVRPPHGAQETHRSSAILPSMTVRMMMPRISTLCCPRLTKLDVHSAYPTARWWHKGTDGSCVPRAPSARPPCAALHLFRKTPAPDIPAPVKEPCFHELSALHEPCMSPPGVIPAPPTPSPIGLTQARFWFMGKSA